MRTRQTLISSCAVLAALLLLASCGGGGGTDNGSPGGGPADLVVTAFSSPSSAAAGSTFTITGTIKNQGGTIGTGAALIYLSPNSNVTIDGDQVGMAVYMGFLDSGQSWNFSTTVTLPTNVANGTYYLSPVAQGDDPSVGGNNVWNSPVSITITGGTDCSDDAYEADNTVATAKTITLGQSQLHNHCDSTSDLMKFSATSGTPYGIITQLVGNMASVSLSLYGTDGVTKLASNSIPWSVYSRMTWTAPANGTYYLKVSPYMGAQHSGANTDYRVTLGDVLHPDLLVDSFWFQGAGLPGGIITVSDDVRNQGFADAAAPFDVSVYISADPVVTSATATLIGTRTVPSLAAGQSNAGSWLEYALPLLPDGTYYLATIVNPGGANELVTSNNTSTVLPITIQAPTGCALDTYELDSTSAQAKPIVVGDPPQLHNFCNDSADWLWFTAEAGKNYSVRVVQTSGYGAPCAQLYASDGATGLAGDCNNSPRAIDWHADSAGTYYIKVSGAVGDANEYTVQVQQQLPDLTQTLTGSYPTTVAAGGLLTFSDAVQNSGYAAAGPFEVGIYRSTSSSVTIADTLVSTRSVTGLPVQTSPWDMDSASYAVSFPKSLATGTYYLAAIADYTDAVTELSETNNTSQPVAVVVTAPSCSWDAYEDDDDPASAKPIAAGETQSRNYCDDALDWISFTPAVDGVYVASSTSSLYLDLYGSDGVTPLTPKDTDMYSKLSWHATAGTKYYLKNHDGSGAYQFTVFQCTPDAFEDDDTPAAAKVIASGDTQVRNLCTDGHDWAKFTAVQNTNYTISATNGVNLWVYLYDTSGAGVLAIGQMGSGQTKGMSLINWLAPADGTYYVEVIPVWGFGQNLDYTLSLN